MHDSSNLHEVRAGIHKPPSSLNRDIAGTHSDRGISERNASELVDSSISGPKAISMKIKSVASGLFNEEPKRETKAQFIDRINEMYQTQLALTFKTEEIKRLEDEIKSLRKSHERKLKKHQNDVSTHNKLLSDSVASTQEVEHMVLCACMENERTESSIEGVRHRIAEMKQEIRSAWETLRELQPFVDMLVSLRTCRSLDELAEVMEYVRELFGCSPIEIPVALPEPCWELGLVDEFS